MSDFQECYCMCYIGGPGSRKGCIVDDLITAYNLQHICTEDILYKELPKRLANVIKIEDVSSMKEALEVNQKCLIFSQLLALCSWLVYCYFYTVHQSS